MPADWTIGDNDGMSEPSPEPFERSALSLVLCGANASYSWELYDGPHPIKRSPDSIGSELRARCLVGPGGGGGGGGAGERLTSDEVASVSSTAMSNSATVGGFLVAQCSRTVASVEVVYDDGSVHHLVPTTSTTTGEHWVVCCLDSPAVPTRLEFLDQAGAVLETQSVQDPRERHVPPRPEDHDGVDA